MLPNEFIGSGDFSPLTPFHHLNRHLSFCALFWAKHVGLLSFRCVRTHFLRNFPVAFVSSFLTDVVTFNLFYLCFLA